MLKKIAESVFSFDIEWIPDPKSAEILLKSPPSSGPDDEAATSFEALWTDARKADDPEDFQPYLKTILCRIVSICGILRDCPRGGDPVLKLISLPTDALDEQKSDEKVLLTSFLKSVGRRKPQLVGYNSSQADVPIIIQRSIVHGLPVLAFLIVQPSLGKEWITFDARNSDYNIDLAEGLGQFRDRPSLHQAASLGGIPGKIDVSGDSVAQMWLDKQLPEILAYNEFDAFTTHLLWARMAHFSGLLATREYVREQVLVRDLLEAEITNGKEHLVRFVEEWDRLLSVTGQD